MALEVGRRLDAAIAEKVMGWRWQERPQSPATGALVYLEGGGNFLEPYQCWSGTEWLYCGLPPYSTDIGAAWAVVERMRSLGFQVDIQDVRLEQGPPKEELWRVHFGRPKAEYCPHLGDSPAHAICLAALRAVGAP